MADWMFDDSYSFDEDEVVDARIEQLRQRLFTITPEDRAHVDAARRQQQELSLKLSNWLLDQCLKRRPR